MKVDPQTGKMNKPFRSAGFYFLGDKSTEFLRGLTLQTCLGMAPQEIVKIKDVDPLSLGSAGKTIWAGGNPAVGG